jgi:hypothetical protein
VTFLNEKQIKRFLSKVQKTESCWIWTGARNDKGYGNFRLNGKTVYSHRVSYEIHKGPIQHKLFVCHSCDNPICLNPGHLFLGSQKDNMVDMKAKGRASRVVRSEGEEHWCSKLDYNKAVEIRASTESQRSLGLKYEVSQYAIYAVKTGKTWKNA